MTHIDHRSFSPDGWVFDPSRCERLSSADGATTYALNVSRVKPLWIRNPCVHVPLAETMRAWDSISAQYAKQSEALRAAAWDGLHRASGRGLHSFSYRGARRVVVFGLPVADVEARGIKFPKKRDDDVWIGVNWALRAPASLDLCWVNSQSAWPGMPRRGINPDDYPHLVCSITTSRQIVDSWPETCFFYTAPNALGIHASDMASIGALQDPGDAACAAVIWALEHARVSEVLLVEADGTRPLDSAASPTRVEYITRGRIAHVGRGHGLAALSAIAAMASGYDVSVETVAGWPLTAATNWPQRDK